MKSNPLNFILDQIEARMPEVLRPLNAEVKKASRRLLQEQLQVFDLVPREVFEAQEARLAAAQRRLAELEARLDALENRVK